MADRPQSWVGICWDILVRPAWRWFVLAPLALLGVFQSIREELPSSAQAKLQLPHYVPTWSWWAWLLIVCGATIIIILLSASRRVRELQSQLIAVQARPTGSTSPILAADQLFIDMDGYNFGEPGTGGYPESAEGTRLWLRTEFHLSAHHDMKVESLELEVLDRRISSNWIPYTVRLASVPFYAYFEVPNWVKSGEHSVKLLAFAGGEWWTSQDYAIDFPVSC